MMKKKNVLRISGSLVLAAVLIMMTACSASVSDPAAAKEIGGSADIDTKDTADGVSEDLKGSDNMSEKKEILNSEDGGHAITADGENASYDNIKVIKTGEADGDEADFYGENSAIFATNGAELNLSNMDISTDGTHANAVFSYGDGTTVNISDSEIETAWNCSGGLMTTGGGTMNAENLDIHTSGNSSAAIRSDRGGGTVTVTGGTYETDGKGSPVIYSTADITVSDAELKSNSSQGVVVEGKNSVTLNDVALTACNNSKNSDKSDTYQAVMIYQSMSGDADEGLASFTMNGGKLVNLNGELFFVNNTRADINLKGAEFDNSQGNGIFLKAQAAGWGNEGSNGGHVNLNATGQTIDGDMIVDDISTLNLYLKEGSTFNGAINTDKQAGDVYVEISDGSSWKLTGNSYITSLTCDTGSIDLNGYDLYVNGEKYTAGTASKGEAIEVVIQGGNGDGNHGNPPDGKPDDGNPPDGKPGDGNKQAPPNGKPGDGNPPDGKPGNGAPPDGKPGDMDTPPDSNK